MPQYFKTILIPVDLSVNTEVSIKKGLDLTDKGAVIHLLHIAQPAGNRCGCIIGPFRFGNKNGLDETAHFGRFTGHL